METGARRPGFSSVSPPAIPPGGAASPGVHTGWALLVTHGPEGVRVTVTDHWLRRLPDTLVPDVSGLRRRVCGPVETRAVEVGGIEVERDECGDRWCALWAGLVAIAAVIEGSDRGVCTLASGAPQGMYDPSSEMDTLV